MSPLETTSVSPIALIAPPKELNMRPSLATSLILTLLAVSGLSGCHSPIASYHRFEHGEKVNTHTASADLRSVHLIEKDGGIWVIAEPMPDSAISTQGSFDLSFSLAQLGGGDDSDDSSSSADNVGLEGRTASVTLTRELMYRLNEMALNTKMDAAQYQATFDKILTVVQAVAVEEMQHSSFTAGYKAAIQSTVTQSDTMTESMTEKGEQKSGKSSSSDSTGGSGESGESGSDQ